MLALIPGLVKLILGDAIIGGVIISCERLLCDKFFTRTCQSVSTPARGKSLGGRPEARQTVRPTDGETWGNTVSAFVKTSGQWLINHQFGVWEEPPQQAADSVAFLTFSSGR